MANDCRKSSVLFLLTLMAFCLLDICEGLLLLKFIEGYVMGRLFGKYHYETTHPDSPY